MAVRLFAVAAIAVAIAVAFWILLGSTGTYRVTATFQNAGQIVRGNQVKVASVPAGSVKEVNLNERNEAELVLEIDEDYAPLHDGTQATVRSSSLASIAGRFVSLTPGPNDGSEIPDGGVIHTFDTTSEVDLDQVLNALDPGTVNALRDVVRGSATAFEGNGEAANGAIEALNPALSSSQRTLAEITTDQRALEDLIVETSGVVDELADRRDDLAVGTAAAGTATEAIASQSESLAAAIGAAPATLRQSNTTLVNLRATLEEARPAIGEARPVARGLSLLLPRLRPVAKKLRREIPDVRDLLRRRGSNNDLTDLLVDLPRLRDAGLPVVRNLTATLSDAQPVVDELRPYLPDLTSGIVAGFGGGTGAYYDGNGHYARISFIGGPFSANNAGQLFPQPPAQFGAGFKSGVIKRCPGSSIYPAPDRSNPFTDKGQLDCDPSLGGGAP